MHTTDYALPVIDLNDLHTSTDHGAFYQGLGRITRDSGFFYLKGHGLDAKIIQDIQQQSLKFFQLPLHEKNKIAMLHSAHFRGYTRVASERTAQRPDYREQIDIGAELPALTVDAQQAAYYRLQGPNQWPDLVGFKEAVEAFQQQAHPLSIALLRHFLIALQQDPHALDTLIDPERPSHLLKLIHYPAAQDASQSQGVGAHKDSGIITLLLQDQVGGLQVKTAQGWKDIPYLEDACIVIIGEALELASNGYLHGNIHRVQAPQNGQDRYSTAFFLTPNIFAGDIPILPLPAELAALAQGPDYDPDNPLYQQIGLNTLKGRLRSHLDVTEKHYPQEYLKLTQQTPRLVAETDS
ncbi:isopenicillin N synthase family dioxygenase [Acinetobacter larvae]|uniref:2-oxoglutarate-dependent ethylene/succinate-forming enzyme n=1 Tax=Acinetobacter larvae TaxID=1789224 RepID=A0A1B2LYH8_9GAMM|nr:2-oxoglutarate and iron-dependent oxygenase domain-containing protein [Acinetobacter larvae]AOA57985.1 hypothetical protein BFG52_06230 [Acinetobacter larvae]